MGFDVYHSTVKEPSTLSHRAWRQIKLDYSQTINLVFFCGLGDAMYGFPAVREMQQRCQKNGVLLNAFVSENPSSTHNPKVAELLRCSGLFDQVYLFSGQAKGYWKYYNWADVYRVADKGQVAGRFYPFLYTTTGLSQRRVDSVKKQFGLSGVPNHPAYSFSMADAGKLLLSRLEALMTQLKPGCQLLLCHFDTRSGPYLWEHAQAFVEKRLAEGHVVITPGSTLGEPISDRHVVLDTSVDVISLGLVLNQLRCKIIALNSLFWAFSGVFDLDILGLQYMRNDSELQYISDRMLLVTPQKIVSQKVADSILLEPGVAYTLNRDNSAMIDYRCSTVDEVYAIWKARLLGQGRW